MKGPQHKWGSSSYLIEKNKPANLQLIHKGGSYEFMNCTHAEDSSQVSQKCDGNDNCLV